jgi:hypothetical protein
MRQIFTMADVDKLFEYIIEIKENLSGMHQKMKSIDDKVDGLAKSCPKKHEKLDGEIIDLKLKFTKYGVIGGICVAVFTVIISWVTPLIQKALSNLIS